MRWIDCPCCAGQGVILRPGNPDARRRGHGRVFRLIRRRGGLTIEQVARELLLSTSTVENMERGRQAATAETIGVYAVLARRAGLDAIARVLEAA